MSRVTLGRNDLRRRRLIAGVATLALICCWVVVWTRNRATAVHGQRSAESRASIAESELAAVSTAESALRRRRLQYKLARTQLVVIDVTMQIAVEQGRTPPGPIDFAEFSAGSLVDEVTESAPDIDASVGFARDAGDGTDACAWSALIRSRPREKDDWTFDRVLRSADGEVFVGWSLERGFDASTVPVVELPESVSEFAQAADPSGATWCPVDAYLRRTPTTPRSQPSSTTQRRS